MLFSKNVSEWDDIVNQTYELEFDFLGIDNRQQLGIFSTVNRGYVPKCVLQSFSEFLLLDEFLETLPKTTGSIFVQNDEKYSIADIWNNYAELGFFAYDYQDIHRPGEKKKNQYDIIFAPGNPLFLHQVPKLQSYLNIIPQFDLPFGAEIKFDVMARLLIEK